MSKFNGLEPVSTNDAVNAIPAGEFGEWLQAAQPAVSNNLESDVPCGDCNACCRASYFIHVTPQDVDAIAAIPAELLFPAPGAPAGYQLMGFNEHGQCPMLVDGQCSIYADRPSACRTYDCRVFAAADIEAGGAEKAEVNERVLRWQFTYADTQSQLAHAAVSKLAQLVQDCAEVFIAADAKVDPEAASPIARFAIEQHAQLLAIHSELEATGQSLADTTLAQRLVEGPT